MNPPIVSDKYLFNSYTPRKRLPYTPRKQSIGSSHSELPHIPWSTEQKLQESHEIDGLKKFVVNRWSDVCWVLPWKGRGRGSGKASWMSWVLNCRGSDWGGAGRKVMAEYSWKGKREKKRQSRVGNGFMMFLFLVLVLLFFVLLLFFLMQCWCGKLWKLEKLRFYIYID